MDKIKFYEKQYELAAGNYFDGGNIEVVFLPGTDDFYTVLAEVKASQCITVFDSASNPYVTRSGLVYGDSLTLAENYTIGAEQVKKGVDDVGEPVYETQDIKATVMTVKFRVPDLRDKLAATSAKVDYVAMMAGIEMEVE